MTTSTDFATEVADAGYDVFLSYSRDDSDIVTAIATALKERGLSVWFDRWNLHPGSKWMEELEKGIKGSRSVAAVIGPKGPGEWARPEMNAAVDRAVKQKARLIPVILPGVPDDLVPLFVQGYQYCPVDESVSKTAIDRLYWGITGRNPLHERIQEQQTSRVEPEVRTPVMVAVDELVKHLASGNVTFFFGRSASHGTSYSDVASKLLCDLDLIEKDWKKLLPPLDLAASYFAAKHGDARLEQQVVDMIAGESSVPPAAYVALAQLQKILAKRPPIRGKKQYKRLIVSNNLDILLEKALLLQGVGFTRLVQFRSSSQLQINTIADVQPRSGCVRLTAPDGSTEDVDCDDDAALGEVLSSIGQRTVSVQSGGMVDEETEEPVLLADMPEPFLYKLHGSRDVDKSCMISSEQYFDTLWRSRDRKCIPDEVARIISNTPVVLLGSRILDADFRLSYTLLRASLESGADYHRYAVLSRGVGDDRDGSQKLAKQAWDELSVLALRKYHFQMLDEREEVFFRRLSDAFLGRQ